MKQERSGPLMRFAVSHPDYPTVTVVSIGKDSATMEAARRWDAVEDWARIAGSCTVEKLGKAQRPRCRKCGREFGKKGGTEAWCPDCEKLMDLARRERAMIRTQDRRAGCRQT